MRKYLVTQLAEIQKNFDTIKEIDKRNNDENYIGEKHDIKVFKEREIKNMNILEETINSKMNEIMVLSDKITEKQEKDKQMEYFIKESENISKIEDADEQVLAFLALYETWYDWGKTNNIDEESLLFIEKQLNEIKRIKEQRTERKETKNYSSVKSQTKENDVVSKIKSERERKLEIEKERKEKEKTEKKEKEKEKIARQNWSSRTSNTNCCVTCEYWKGTREVGNLSRTVVQYPSSGNQMQGRCHRPGVPLAGESRAATQNCGKSWRKWAMLK
jgi:hypothetical protein